MGCICAPNEASSREGIIEKFIVYQPAYAVCGFQTQVKVIVFGPLLFGFISTSLWSFNALSCIAEFFCHVCFSL